MAALPSTSVRRLQRPLRRHGIRRRPTSPIITRRRQLLLVANGSASGLDRDTVDGLVAELRARGAGVEARVTASLAELSAAWHEADGRRVVLVGGDGSVHAAVNLSGDRHEIALIPAGRANNIAHSTGIPVDPVAAVRLAVEGTPRSLDLIEASNGQTRRLAVEGASAGLHAIARATYSAPNSADLRAGARAALSAARSFDGVSLHVESDGRSELLQVGQLFVANTPLFAFGLHVAPEARMDDGLLDVVALDWRGRARLVPMLHHLRHGEHLSHPGARSWRASRIRIASGGNSPVIADTTDLGSGSIELRAVPGALTLVAPRS